MKKPKPSPKEELELEKAVDDLFAFFGEHPEIERAWIEGKISLEDATASLEVWRDARTRKN